ncbi:MAG: UDP-4-amino-4,6-dideoxy-N-acetyl-beta-L-altrosamine transaminase [Gemmatimonadaceae bacterium]
MSAEVVAPPAVQLPIPYGRQCIGDDDIEAVVRVLRGDWLTQGPSVTDFEAALCTELGASHAVAMNSGTAILHIGMAALGIGPGDVVVVPPITFVASANAALYCGADVAFVDVEPDTGLISRDALETFLATDPRSDRVRAVVAVHYAGLPCDMSGLASLCASRDIALIEDACHAPGATWTDADGAVHAVGDGSVSAFTVLSFHPVKHVTTGEGGALLTNDSALAQRAAMLRSHGITRDPSLLQQNDGPWYYEQHELGFNYRMPDVLAALGTSQLTKHVGWLQRRREVAAMYREALGGVEGVRLQAERPGREHAYHLFPVLVSNRRSVFEELVRRGIRPQVHYIPVHRQPYYRARYGDVTMPGADAWYAAELSLPMFQGITDEQVAYVCDSLRAAVGA